jgi:glycosyltransferase involved in cell wall biosynthesis
MEVGRMKINLIACCKNEEFMLPFFLDYYTKFVDQIIIYDGNSDDNSKEIIKSYAHKGVKLVVQDHEKCDERELMDIRNEEWKKYRNEFDWQIVCDIDEILYPPQVRKLLEYYDSIGVTVPCVDGFEMIGLDLPERGKNITTELKTGYRDKTFSKNMIFNPKKVDINYDWGCHRCFPTGEVKYSTGMELSLLHYKRLSYEYFTNKCRLHGARLSDYSLQSGAGTHNLTFAEMPKDEYEYYYNQCFKVVQ